MKVLSDIQAFKSADGRIRLTIVLCLALISLSVVSFLYFGIYRSFEYAESDPYFFYTAGVLWDEGQNPYDYQLFRNRFEEEAGKDIASLTNAGMAYPPQTALYLSIFGHFPFKTAQLMMLVINVISMIATFILFAYIMSWFRPIGLIEITFLALFLNTGYARTGIRMAHLSAIICLFILLMFILAQRNRQTIPGMFLGLLSIKPTFMVHYLAYFVIRKRFRLVIICIVVALLATLLPLVLTGRPIVDSIRGWIEMLGLRGTVGDVDDPSPFVSFSANLSHLQPLVYRILNQQSLVTTMVSWIIIGVGSLYAAYLVYIGPKTKWGYFLDFSLFSALSMMSIYHRNYDIFLMFPALIGIFLHTATITNARVRRWWIASLVVIVAMLSLPNDILQQIYFRFPDLANQYWWRVIAPFQIWAGVVIVGQIFWLKRQQAYQRETSTKRLPAYTAI